MIPNTVKTTFTWTFLGEYEEILEYMCTMIDANLLVQGRIKRCLLERYNTIFNLFFAAIFKHHFVQNCSQFVILRNVRTDDQFVNKYIGI